MFLNFIFSYIFKSVSFRFFIDLDWTLASYLIYPWLIILFCYSNGLWLEIYSHCLWLNCLISCSRGLLLWRLLVLIKSSRHCIVFLRFDLSYRGLCSLLLNRWNWLLLLLRYLILLEGCTFYLYIYSFFDLYLLSLSDDLTIIWINLYFFGRFSFRFNILSNRWWSKRRFRWLCSPLLNILLNFLYFLLLLSNYFFLFFLLFIMLLSPCRVLIIHNHS